MLKKKSKEKQSKRSIATSKLMGLMVAIVVIIVIIYSMIIIAILSNKAIQMSLPPDFTPLNTLIGGMLALAAAYVGFYINMAKAEHIADKKNEIAQEIKRIEKDGITIDEQKRLEELKDNLENLNNNLEEINSNDNQIDIKTFL